MLQDIGDNRLRIGDEAPQLDLPGIDGNSYTLDSFRDAKLLAVIFTCNHCPLAQAYEERLIAVQSDYADRGVRLVAINSNDERGFPEDSFENMVERARLRGFNFPYLRDADQGVAAAYGAQCTPEVFVFDRERLLRYHGRIDDNWQFPEQVRQRDLRDALDALLASEHVA